MLFRLNCDFKLTVDVRPVVCLYDVLVQGVSTFHPTTAHPPENGCMGHQLSSSLSVCSSNVEGMENIWSQKKKMSSFISHVF